MLKSSRVLCVCSSTAQNTSYLMASICFSCCSCKCCVHYVCVFLAHAIVSSSCITAECERPSVFRERSGGGGSWDWNMSLSPPDCEKVLKQTWIYHVTTSLVRHKRSKTHSCCKWMLLYMHYICITLWSDIESYFYFFPLVCRTLGGSRDACCFILWADGVQDCRLYISSLPTTPDFLLSSNNRQQQLPSERS